MRKMISGIIMIVLLLMFWFPYGPSSANIPSPFFGHNWSESAFAFEVDLNNRSGSYSLIADLTPGETGLQEEDANAIVDFEQFFAYINTSQLELAFIAQERWQEEITTQIQISIEDVSLDIPLTSKINSSIPLIGFLGHLEHFSSEYYIGGAFLGLMLTGNSEESQNDLLVGYPLSDTRLLMGLEDFIDEETDLNHSFQNTDSLPLFESNEDSFRFGISYRNLTIFWHNESLSDGIILRSSSFGVTTFSWLNFTFLLRPNFGHIHGRAIATLVPQLDIGPISFLAINEAKIPPSQWTEAPTLIEVDLNLQELLNLPETYLGQPISYKETFKFGVYHGLDVSSRLSMEGGRNLSVLMALNSYSSALDNLEITSDGQSITALPDKSRIETNLTITSDEMPVFMMNHQGKDKYVSYDATGEPSLKNAYISAISPSTYSSLSATLYDEGYQLLDIMLDPFVGNTTDLFANTTQPLSNLINWGFTTAKGHYLIELDQWNGLPVIYDPEFFFFLNEDDKLSSQTTSSVSTSILGFFLIMTCLPIIQRYRSKKR
ncbi:MAG: hypothetical protein ACE5OZ_06990 [Candidatus Heimdallarchaeota archaeon]